MKLFQESSSTSTILHGNEKTVAIAVIDQAAVEGVCRQLSHNLLNNNLCGSVPDQILLCDGRDSSRVNV